MSDSLIVVEDDRGPDQEAIESVKIKRSWLVVIFALSFVVFLYVSFPFGVLKEYVAAQIFQQTGMQVQIGYMGLKLPIGLKLKDVQFTGKSERDTLRLKQLNLTLSTWRLFFLSAGIGVYAEAGERGRLDLSATLPLWDLLGGQAVPKSIQMSSTEFPVGPSVGFALMKVAQSEAGANPILKELLENIIFEGALESEIDFRYNSSDPTRSVGKVDIQFKGARFSLADPKLNIAPQNFEVATLKAEVSDGALVIDNQSRFKSQGIDVRIDGKITLNENFQKSPVAVNLSLQLDADLKENYGFFLGSGGGMKGEFRGFLSKVDFVKR